MDSSLARAGAGSAPDQPGVLASPEKQGTCQGSDQRTGSARDAERGRGTRSARWPCRIFTRILHGTTGNATATR